MEIVIRPPSASEFSEWKNLWDSYLVFYETERSREHSESLWQRILDPESLVRCHIALQDGHLIGLVHFLPHEDTWNSHPICYLQDLYVEASHRGGGIGAKLIASVVEYADLSGWSAVYWLTADDNHTARILYDKLTGGASAFIHYEIDTSSNNPQSQRT